MSEDRKQIELSEAKEAMKIIVRNIKTCMDPKTSLMEMLASRGAIQQILYKAHPLDYKLGNNCLEYIDLITREKNQLEYDEKKLRELQIKIKSHEFPKTMSSRDRDVFTELKIIVGRNPRSLDNWLSLKLMDKLDDDDDHDKHHLMAVDYWEITNLRDSISRLMKRNFPTEIEKLRVAITTNKYFTDS